MGWCGVVRFHGTLLHARISWAASNRRAQRDS
jgi:hypothetical protein